ncbi:MAG: hypothetical protein EOO38_32550 [Cytophagaceae bacterium]|nr:MAG: hypothetical protein EOO38_32550 [Cytophagaceae bacterium]
MAVTIVGMKISSFSRAVLSSIAEEAGISTLTVTSVQRSVEDQARIFFNKHVVQDTPANYKSPAVKPMIKKAKNLLLCMKWR